MIQYCYYIVSQIIDIPVKASLMLQKPVFRLLHNDSILYLYCRMCFVDTSLRLPMPMRPANSKQLIEAVSYCFLGV